MRIKIRKRGLHEYSVEMERKTRTGGKTTATTGIS
jgi:hypothetical protein